MILPYVRRRLLAVNEQLEQTINGLNGLETGHLTIAAFASISRNWLPHIIHAFEKSYPAIKIELMEGGTDEIVSWVENSIADFGLLSKLHTGSLQWIKLADDPMMAILPKDFYCLREVFPISKMADEPFIMSAEGVDYHIHQALESAGIVPNVHLSRKDDHSIVSMVSSELGVSILPELVIRIIQETLPQLLHQYQTLCLYS